MQNVKVNDIFVSSWGWEQTNVDFYQVVKARDKTAWVRILNSKITGLDSSMSGYRKAIYNSFYDDEILKKNIKVVKLLQLQ